jgi:hypothetical protein
MSVEQLKFDGTEVARSLNKQPLLEEFRHLVERTNQTAHSVIRQGS